MARVVAAAWVIIMALGARDVDAAPASPLDRPSFTATAAELLAAAKAVPAGDWPVVILRDDTNTAFDDQGRATERWRRVFVVTTQAGVDEWGALGMQWRPFYQDKPVIRLRVIGLDGKVTELDQALITDAPTVESDGNVFSDTRKLDVPLPRMQVGVVVEEEVTTIDRTPMLPSGNSERYWLSPSVLALSTRVTLSAPAARKAKHVERALPKGVHATHEVVGGRELWHYEVGTQTPSTDDDESSIPSDVVVAPYVGIASAASWNIVARDYGALLARQIAAGPPSLPPDLPKTATLATVRALTSWLHARVRYTGIEFGEASVVPWSPAETLKRGFGDCKDKAILLVALLRQVGVRAELVLLDDGPGEDIDADLPSIGMFDHAIVRASVEGKEVWIDATEELLAAGQLPARDHGRRALVISDDAKATVITPIAGPAANTIRETRTYELAEHDGAHVVEVSHEGGVFERDQRDWIRSTRADDVTKSLTEYLKGAYGAKLDKFQTTNPDDIATPFTVTVAGSAAQRAYTDREQIAVTLYPHAALQKLPFTLSKPPKQPRRHELAWFIPHVYEVENRLVVPTGYTMPKPAPDRVQPLGTTTLTTTQRVEGTTLVVTFRFETGKLRLTAAEVKATQDGIKEAMDAEVRIVIEHTASALSAHGQPAAALAEVDRLIALHPKEALHHMQRAAILMRAGMGDAARRSARKAVDLEPANADAYSVLAWMLRHDTIGRDFGFDHDRAGALAAYAKARKLDPTHVGAASGHAYTLERDARGLQYEDGADVRGAAQAWRAVVELDPTTENKLSLLRSLVWSRQLVEAEKLARSMPPSASRDPLLIATIAMSPKGAAAAIEMVDSLDAGAERTRLLESSLSTLMRRREYAAAKALVAAGSSIQVSTQTAKMIGLLDRAADTTKPSKDPKLALIEGIRSALDSDAATWAFWDADTALEMRRASASHGYAAALASVGSGRFVMDTIASIVELKVEGSPALWRIMMSALGRPGGATYAVLDRGAARLLGDTASQGALGRFVLHVAAQGDLKTAMQLLDWVRADVAAAPARKQPKLDPLLTTWGDGVPRDKPSIQLAGALMAVGSDASVVIPILARCESTKPDVHKLCDSKLAYAYMQQGRFAEAEAQLAVWAARDPAAAEEARSMRGLALAELGRFDDAEKQLDDVLATWPASFEALELRAEVAFTRGRPEQGAHFSDALAALQGVPAAQINNLAWARGTLTRDLAAALELIRRAILEDKRSMFINTLAVVEAESNDLGQAITDEHSSMTLGNRRTPDPADWYVFARVAEQLGLRDDAIVRYHKAALDKTRSILPTSAGLAKQRLTKLGVKP